jgi:hypothetical protein
MSDIFQRISIPKPCHEDWNKMTPDQQGAFCKVCNKSVHDFSRKTAKEVEQILLREEEGKVCGRFRSDQIVMPKDLEIPLHLLPRNISPFRAFALAVFIVFGTALFGITDASGQGLKGKVCIKPPVKEVPRPQNEPVRPLGNVTVTKVVPPLADERKEETMGKVKCINRKPMPPEPEELHKKGEVMVVKRPDPEVVNPDKIMVVGDTVISPKQPVKPETKPKEIQEIILPTDMVLGGVSMVSAKKVAEPEIVKIETPAVDKPLDEIGYTPDKQITPILQDIQKNLADFIDTVKCDMIVGQMAMRQDPLAPETINPDTLKKEHYAREIELKPGIRDTETVASVTEKQLPALNGSADGLSCFPNPTNGQATLKYTLAKRCDVLVEVYDVLGNRIKTLIQINNHYEGQYNTGIDLAELPNGEYIIRMQAGNSVMGTRVLVNK